MDQASISTLPLVSVIMTSFNRELYIAEAIESVLASTYKNFELIIVDDCSNDNTVVIAKKFEERDNRIKVYVNEKNLKDYPNRNCAASYARGVYLKYVDSDDLIYPWGLEAMVDCMEKHPNAGYGLISYGLDQQSRFPIIFTPKEAYLQFYFKGSMIITGPTGSIFRRTAFETAGGFSGIPYLGDIEMWLKMSRSYCLVAMPLQLVWWRQHQDQQIKEGTSNNYYAVNSYHLLLNNLISKDCPLLQKDKKLAIRNLKNRYCRNLMLDILKGKIKASYFFIKNYKLKFVDFLLSFQFNKYPKY